MIKVGCVRIGIQCWRHFDLGSVKFWKCLQADVPARSTYSRQEAVRFSDSFMWYGLDRFAGSLQFVWPSIEKMRGFMSCSAHNLCTSLMAITTWSRIFLSRRSNSACGTHSNHLHLSRKNACPVNTTITCSNRHALLYFAYIQRNTDTG